LIFTLTSGITPHAAAICTRPTQHLAAQCSCKH